ncbi:EAL domain-containing protein [Psychrosphaera sp. B3R10]|uniref:7TM diverse intracellular signaling domain-containing protein n=1 Tax=unclassified Psychrosphaera TaxID=2641570 RepID=UPI001C0A00AC|nr:MULTISPECIES: 7TM diverse intracellular signaling domain-containing protein [unclassified Psychrosphaera]MBU2882243.1 EAL domain-containing protein [Psychrosphaera sp. I2R16]MBU2988924.1 EAL domain-containing protein [Psychrosphaera sp. B3R10]
MKKAGSWAITGCVLFILFSLLWGIKSSFDRINELNINTNNLQLKIDQAYFVDDKNQFVNSNYSEFKSRFRPTKLNYSKIEFGESDVWYQLKFRNLTTTKMNLVLLLDNPMLDYIDIYELKNNDLHVLSKLGDKRKNTELELLALPHSVIELNGSGEMEMVIRTNSKGTPNLPISIFTNENFEQYKSMVFLIWGSFVGIVILMSIYNIILFVGVKDKLYLIYVGYIFAFLVVLGVVHGFLTYLVPYWVYDLIADNVIALFSMVGALMLAFAMKFLKFDQDKRSLSFRTGQVVINLLLALSFYALFVVEYKAAQLFFMAQGSVYIFAIILVAIRLKLDFSWAKYYVISWLPLFIGAAVGPLMLTGNLEYSFWSRHALLLGVLFEMTFISMALAERLRMSENQLLFQATHDHFLNIGNSIILEQQLKKQFDVVPNPSFSLVVIKIENYHQLTPYLDQISLKVVVDKFLTKVETFFSDHVTLATLDEHIDVKHIAAVKDGYFALVILSTDQILIDNLQDEIGELLPFTYRLKGFDVSFNCFISCVNSAEFESPEEIITFSFNVLQQSNRATTTFQTFEKRSSDKRHQLVSELVKSNELQDFQIGFQPTTNSVNSKLSLVKLSISSSKNNEFFELSACLDTTTNNMMASLFEERVFELICSQVALLGSTKTKFLIDLSTQNRITKTFISMLIKTLNKYGLKADLFVITVSSKLMNSQNIQEISTLREFVDLGFLISIKEDTFGIESANWISELPISVVTFQAETMKKLIRTSDPERVLNFSSTLQKMDISILVENIKNQTDFDELKVLPFNLVGALSTNVLSEIEFKEYIDQRFIDSLAKDQSLHSFVLNGVKS